MRASANPHGAPKTALIRAFSSAAGEGGYAKTLATVFLRPYGLALAWGKRRVTKRDAMV